MLTCSLKACSKVVANWSMYWPLTLKGDLDHDMSFLKCSLPWDACACLNIKSPYLLVQQLCPFCLWPWRMALTCHPLKLWSFKRYMCVPSIKSLPQVKVWPFTLKDNHDFNMWFLKMCSVVRYVMHAKYQVSITTWWKLWPVLKSVIWSIYLTFDLEGWLWP